jgi:nucleoside-diphosphate-sugar epimerase
MRNDVLITGGHGFIGRRIQGGKRYSGRVEDYDELAKSMKGMTGIVHMAAKSNWRECDENPEDCIETNLFGLINVLDAAVFRNCWVIFISTFQYKDPTLYGMSKLMGEELCRIYKNLYGLRVKILRLPVVYGPGDKPCKIVNRLISQIKAGKDPKITLNKRLQFVFVEDMARIIEREVSVMGGCFGPKVSIRSLADGIRKCLR